MINWSVLSVSSLKLCLFTYLKAVTVFHSGPDTVHTRGLPWPASQSLLLLDHCTHHNIILLLKQTNCFQFHHYDSVHTHLIKCLQMRCAFGESCEQVLKSELVVGKIFTQSMDQLSWRATQVGQDIPSRQFFSSPPCQSLRLIF